MPVERFSCPECRSVLKPSKPLPEGRKLMCPKCGAKITVPCTPPAAVTARSPAGAAKPATKPSPSQEAEDAGWIYGVINDTEEEEKRKRKEKEDEHLREEEKEDEEYDPRGPAQAALVRPSNHLLRIAAFGALFGALHWAIATIMICMPPPPDDEKPEEAPVPIKVPKSRPGQVVRVVEQPKDAAAKKKPPLYDLILQALYIPKPKEDSTHPTLIRLLFTLPLLFIVLYEAVIVCGAVKIQKMESRVWGIISSFMVMIPVHMSPIIAFFSCVFVFVASITGDLPAPGQPDKTEFVQRIPDDPHRAGGSWSRVGSHYGAFELQNAPQTRGRRGVRIRP